MNNPEQSPTPLTEQQKLNFLVLSIFPNNADKIHVLQYLDDLHSPAVMLLGGQLINNDSLSGYSDVELLTAQYNFVGNHTTLTFVGRDSYTITDQKVTRYCSQGKYQLDDDETSNLSFMIRAVDWSKEITDKVAVRSQDEW